MAERIRRRRAPGRWQRLRRVPAGVYAAAVAALAVIGAVVYTLAVAGSPTQLEDHVVSLRLDQPGQATVVYEVSKAPLAEARCTLQAQDVYHDPIGRLTQTIGPNNANLRSTTHTAVIRLDSPTARAVTAFIQDCRITLTRLQSGPIP